MMALRLPVWKAAHSCRMLCSYQGLQIYTRFRSEPQLQEGKYICTSCVRHDERRLKADSEMSWVRRILQGSGPSAEVDETSPEDEVVEVEPRYMEILQETQTSFITRPETRRKSYSPPSDVEESLEEMTLQFTTETDPVNWKEMSTEDNLFKFKLLSRCAQTFEHSVPSYRLRKMKTVGDVLQFYQTPVKDTSVYDELSTKDLPPNLRIQWDYNDSKLEVYEEYLEYVKRKRTRKPPEWPYRPSH